MKNATFSDLQSFLEKPDSYPHPVDDLQYIQTHISHVYIAGSFVYKFKKAIDFGFLDYSTLQKRKEFCYREIELNRRLTEGVYLGVVGIAEHERGYRFEENPESQEIVEYAVKMEKLSDEHFLHQYIKEKRLENEHLDRIADILSDFYKKQEKGKELSKWGTVDAIKTNTDENFDQTESFIDHTINGNTFKAINFFTNQYLDKHNQLFQKRIDEERIVDGHGDLHLDHIHITPQKIQIYDCIEFNDRFRYGDLAADLAFLAMDLDFNQCRNEERYFVRQMSAKMGDPDLLQIIDFYKCYRAYVKGKVKSLQSVEDEIDEKDRKPLVDRASDYFKLSLRYALFGSGPVVIVVMGRVGAGKSTIAKHLSDQINSDYYSSDIIRKTLAGITINERTPLQKRESLYSSQMSGETYENLISKAIESFKKGKPIILDATFSNPKLRKKLITTLEKEKIEYKFVETVADNTTIVKRLKEREEKKDVISDARLEDFERVSSFYNSPVEIDNKHMIKINTDHSFGETISQLYTKLINRNLEKV
ncbi:MAG: AAA family ATPase [Balneolaceae bacterium]